MRMRQNRAGWWRLSAVLSGALFFLSGCDAQTRAVIESGIIDTSTSVLTSFLQALIQLASEAADTTAMILIDSAGRFCA